MKLQNKKSIGELVTFPFSLVPRKLLVLATFALYLLPAFGQTPEKMSYQAVIRNTGGTLVTSTQIGMEINIRQGSETGTVVYTETQTPTTNANGLVSIEIGGGTGFNTIDWAIDTYYIETKTDPTGGTTYTITGTSQLLSVPYALHAKTAETITGGMTETDPVYSAWDKSTGISITESQISDLGNYVESETDPIYSDWDKSTGISITESQISDLGTYLETEADPAVAANFDFADAATGDLLQFNGTKWVKVTPDYISDYTVTESDVTAHQAALAITESQISDLGTYLETETDPAVAANFDFTGATNGDLLQFNGTKWVKVTPNYISDYTVTESDVTAHQAALEITESQITDLGTYLETEIDPSVPNGTHVGQMQYWDGTAWVLVEAAIWNESVLTFINGVPTWYKEGATEIVDVTNPITGAVWMDRNLGASQVATSSVDASSYGDLYQWGRAADGHESRTSATTSTLATSDTPGHGDFITNGSSPMDWRTPQNDNLWQGVNGINNPCPSGYRLPTDAEWEAERINWGSNNAAGAFASPLKLTKSGQRKPDDATLINVGTFSYYWSSTISGTAAKILFFYDSDSYVAAMDRSWGGTIRCIKD